LRAAVERVLRERSYRANARRVAGLLAAAPGPAGAAALLDELAAGRDRQPQVVR
jgi:UDP:flavonoid glycosyltransferase YjiC (YdhE family)